MASPLYPMPTPSWLLPKVNSNPLAAFLGDPRQFLRDNSSALIGLGAGIAGGGPDFGQAVSAGLSGAGQGAQIDTQRNQTQAQENQTRAWLQANYPQYANLPVDQGWAAAMKDMGTNLPKADPAEVATYKFYAKQESDAGRTPKSFADWFAGSKQAAKAGLGNPLPYRDSQGAWHAVEPMSDGTAVDLNTGKPPTPDLVYDPFGFAAGKTGVVVDAKTAGGARQSLPGAEQAYAITKKALDNFDPNNNSPEAQSVRAGEEENFGKIFGFIPNQMVGLIVPGTNRANFRNIVDQLSGNAFLQIRQALKGAGQITDFEGQKGEIAISRMKAAVESGDDAAFKQALLDFQTAMENGLALLRKQANSEYAAGQPAVTGQGQQQTLTYNPATGELE